MRQDWTAPAQTMKLNRRQYLASLHYKSKIERRKLKNENMTLDFIFTLYPSIICQALLQNWHISISFQILINLFIKNVAKRN